MSQRDEEPALSGTFADAQAAMRKGRGTSLLAVGALGIAIAAALMLLVGGDDEARVYGEIGRRVNGLKRANFDQFWACALETENVADISSNTELAVKIDARGQERGRRYGVHLRERCLPKLEKIAPELETLIVPADLQPQVSVLARSNGQLRGSISEYVAYLDDPGLSYDPAIAKPHLAHIVRAWYDFKKAHAEINALIRSKLK